MTIQHYDSATPVQMLPSRQWPAAVHRFTPQAVAALHAAEATGRPLLIRGLPGVGKSMTARAAAVAAGRPFLSFVIDGRTEAQDLMYRFDQVRRLGDAQALQPGQALRAERDYVMPQVLWWAFDWPGANARRSELPIPVDDVPTGWRPEHDRVVVLLDELDKADPEAANGLLEALAGNGFAVPITGEVVRCPPQRRPLVVITTNEEREMSSALLRRCLVLNLELPDEEDELAAEFEAIGAQHQTWLMDERVAQRKAPCLVLPEAAALVARARMAARLGGADYLPGTSEFLDLVAAVAELYPGSAEEQRRQLLVLQDFVLCKTAPRQA